MHVRTVGSAASDCAASGRRSRLNRATSSSAKCSESAALPPLPNVYTRPPPPYAAITARAISSTCGRRPSIRPASATWSASAPGASATRRPVARVDDCRRARDADAVAERRRDDLGDAARRAHRAPANRLPHRAEQLLARTEDASAEDDELRLEEVHDRGHAAGERLHGLVPHRDRERVALARGGGDLGRGARGEPGLARALGDRRSRDVGLEAPPAAAAAALPPVPVDGDMAELAAVPHRAAVE